MNADELRTRAAALSPIDEGLPFTWHNRQWSIRQHIARDNPTRFLKWSTVATSMFVGTGAASVPAEARQLSERYRQIIAEPGFGGPEITQAFGVETSGNLIHQAYHLMQFEVGAGVQLDEISDIVEFGGGYGALVILCRRLGFLGEYIIVDLPEMSLLQEYYLSNTIGLDNVTLTDSWEGETDLLIAICSLSEVNVGVREDFLGGIDFEHCLIRYQHRWDGLDNHEWFGPLDGLRYTDKVDTNHWYLIR